MTGHVTWPAAKSGQAHTGCAFTGPFRALHPGSMHTSLKCRRWVHQQEGAWLPKHSTHRTGAKGMSRHIPLRCLQSSLRRGQGADSVLDGADLAETNGVIGQEMPDFPDVHRRVTSNGQSSERGELWESNGQDQPSPVDLHGATSFRSEGGNGDTHKTDLAVAGVHGGEGTNGLGSVLADVGLDNSGADNAGEDDWEDSSMSLSDSEDLVIGLDGKPSAATPSFIRTKVCLIQLQRETAGMVFLWGCFYEAFMKVMKVMKILKVFMKVFLWGFSESRTLQHEAKDLAHHKSSG